MTRIFICFRICQLIPSSLRLSSVRVVHFCFHQKLILRFRSGIKSFTVTWNRIAMKKPLIRHEVTAWNENISELSPPWTKDICILQYPFVVSFLAVTCSLSSSPRFLGLPIQDLNPSNWRRRNTIPTVMSCLILTSDLHYLVLLDLHVQPGCFVFCGSIMPKTCSI